MSNLLSFTYEKNLKEIRHLDLKASHAMLSECLKMIGLNDLPENIKIKEQIKIAIKKLEQAK